MKLQRLAGYGPSAAYVSAGALFLFFFILIFGTSIAQSAPGIAAPMTIVYILAFWVWLGGLAVVVFDLEWLEHPATSTRWFQIAHWATLVALVVPVILGLALIANLGAVVTASFVVTFLLVGISLLIHNIDARRAGLLRGVLPWLGILAGLGYIGAALGVWSLPLAGFAGLIEAQAAYILWAFWMGIRLGRTRATASTTQAPVTR